MDAVDNQNSSSQSKNYCILKGRFKSNSLNFYGLFLLIFNSRRELDISHILVSTFSSAYDMEPFFGWEQYEEFIVNAKWKGNYNPNMTVSIEDYFKKITSDKNGQIDKLLEYITNYDYDNIDTFMFDIINRIIHDKNLILETNVQEASENEFRQAKENRAKKNETVAKDSGKHESPDEEGVTLSIQLILAPVSGKPIYELKIGDVIMCKILPNTDRANYFIDLLDLRIENVIKPVPCKVIDIKSEGKGEPIEILTEIGPGIYGKCIEDERQVKLRMYDPAIDGRMSKKDLSGIKKESGKESVLIKKFTQKRNINISKILYITFGILVILSLIIISFYLVIL